MNIAEGSTIPNYLVYVCLTDKGLTKDTLLDATLGDPTKTYAECFYTTTINAKDYCAVGRCHISPLPGHNPTGKYEPLDDAVFLSWSAFFDSTMFYAPADLPEPV